jgi:hypothetical protein
MSANNSWLGHDLVSDREVKVAGELYKHRRCERCRRDFVVPPGGSDWVAAHVGLLEFILLDDETNHQWLSEECPGAPLG